MSANESSFRAEEKLLWEANPSMRTLMPAVVFATVIFVVIAVAGFFLSGMISRTGGITAGVLLGIIGSVWLLIIMGMIAKAFINSRSLHYRLTTQRIFVERGLFSIRTDEVELERYKDVFLTQSFLDRLVGCGDIKIVAGDPTTPTVDVINIADPVSKKELIRNAARERQANLRIVRREDL